MAVKKLSFSYSKMGMYKECPQKYKFRYVHMLPEQPKYYFAFGSALHEVMEYIYNPAQPVFPTLQESLGFFQTHWNATSFDQKGYSSMDKELAGYAEGRRIIESYYGKHANTFEHPLSVEIKSTLDLDGLNLISILDRIDYKGDGRVQILDYKTGKSVAREPDQLYMYQKVVENSPAVKMMVQQKDPGVNQIIVDKLSFYHLPSLTELSFERATENEIDQFWGGVLRVADDIRAAKFSPTPEENKCRWCDYRNICPVFTGKEYDGPSGWGARNPCPPGVGAEPVEPVAASTAAVPVVVVETPKTDQEILSEKIDRLGELTAETARLKQEIIKLMTSHDFARHFGSHFSAELLKTEQLEFADHQKVIDTLKELNLLKKVLVPTKTTIAALLQDAALPAAQKQSLAALATVTPQVDVEIKKTE